MKNSNSIVVIGKENVGKSQLVASLSGAKSRSANFRGSTVSCEHYQSANGDSYIDTPGILRQSDNETTQLALDQLRGEDRVLVVAQATHLDDDLRDLLPLVKNKRGVVAVSFWDKIETTPQARETLQKLGREIGVALVPIDARHLEESQRDELRRALENSQSINSDAPRTRAGWRIEPKRNLFDVPVLGAMLSLFLLISPAVVAVYFANTFAAIVDPAVQNVTARLVEYSMSWPLLLREVFAGRYGLATMGPLLFVWAIPTVVLYALFLGAYQASGLVERASQSLHPWLRRVGLGGRDLVRVLMGFGCNVPAVISTRACSSCSRGTCVSAIAFGSACSYQFGATLGVFAAAKQPQLVWIYLAYLGATTLIYTRLVSPKIARSSGNLMVTEGRTFLIWPKIGEVWRGASGTLREFFRNALPIFFAITFLASLLEYFGVLSAASRVLEPLMRAFNLPSESALAVVMASIRKDGILLLAEPKTLAALSPLQILVGVYLAGVLLPCLVTLLTIAREQGRVFAAKLLARQVAAALCFTLLLAWGGQLLWR